MRGTDGGRAGEGWTDEVGEAETERVSQEVKGGAVAGNAARGGSHVSKHVISAGSSPTFRHHYGQSEGYRDDNS
jgi:hypothetical protein